MIYAWLASIWWLCAGKCLGGKVTVHSCYCFMIDCSRKRVILELDSGIVVIVIPTEM